MNEYGRVCISKRGISIVNIHRSIIYRCYCKSETSVLLSTHLLYNINNSTFYCIIKIVLVAY